MQLPKLSAPTVVHVVRHAEKAVARGMRDVPLTEAGMARARDLAVQIPTERVAAVFVTPYLRTRQTASKVIEAAGVEPEVFPANDISSFVINVSRFAGHHVVIVGHCDTVPHVLEGLGVRERVSLTLEDYGDLFSVHLGEGPVRLVHGRFGVS